MIDSDVFTVQLKVNLTSSRSDRTADLVATPFFYLPTAIVRASVARVKDAKILI